MLLSFTLSVKKRKKKKVRIEWDMSLMSQQAERQVQRLCVGL